MTKIEELEAKLAEKRAARDAARDEQYAKDLEARIALEDEHGNVAVVKVGKFLPGQPTCACVRTPTSAEYKRYKDRVQRALAGDKRNVKDQAEAGEQLARSCWVYPASPEDRASMLEAFPGILTSLQIAAAALAEGKAEAEGKD